MSMQQTIEGRVFSGGQFFFPLCFLAIGVAGLYEYVNWILLPFVLGIAAIATSSGKMRAPAGPRYAITALIFLVLAVFVPVKTMLFFSLAFTVFFWMELKGARVGVLSLAAMIIGSPAFAYAANAFSFPIRLQLSHWVGHIFSFWQSDVAVQGNTILYAGQEFAVDPACMGLHMLSVSLLLGIILVGLMQRKSGKVVNGAFALGYLLCLFILNIMANMIRILVLVHFSILPGNSLHDITGLLCLFLYVCVPGAFLARALVSKTGKPEIKTYKAPGKQPGPLLWFLLAALVFTGIRVKTVDTYPSFANVPPVVPGYTASFSAPGILKLEDAESLIYIKFIRGFYDTEHNPTMCWKGSGYEFMDIKTENISGHQLFAARLKNGKETLYTAWWFGNHERQFTGQWEWRWDLFKTNRRYAVVNITAASKEVLVRKIKDLLSEQKLKPLFEK